MYLERERLKVVGIGGTLREGSSSLGALRRSLAAAEEAGAEGLSQNNRSGDRNGEAVGVAV